MRTSVADGVAVLTVDRPAVRNAIGLATMDAMSAALDSVRDAGVLVIRGGGDRAFISGGDLKELARIRSFDSAVAMAAGGQVLAYILTGAPGAGKTAVLRLLETLGYPAWC